MRKFEYNILRIPNSGDLSLLIQQLDISGSESWELISVVSIANNQLQLFFKREIFPVEEEVL
jgi:hypothetical protein